ncbi:MAG: UbiH/UbiF/VisC/COQ6 family ubiquinone biosynthesis hydroxylase [Alphaproteobacteria bacterium]|nr:UbiH/UbiF/VisC/COQ6 family ubiquinone biosynthesis hydroxylase [Alphaproteobacteria bacterium]
MKRKQTKSMIHRGIYDAVIIGGGPAGLTLTCLLAGKGLQVLCLDRPAPQQQALRTTAISYGSRKILEEAGIWKNLDAAPCPIEKIDVLESDSPVLLDFLSEDMGGKTFGWIVLNSDLRKAMLKTLRAQKRAEYIDIAAVKDFEVEKDFAKIILQDGKTICTKLVVGADGRNSFVRNWMDVPVKEWDYRQRAVLCTALHENHHEFTAVEHFWPQGPFAILPMSDDEEGRHRSAVVLTEHGPKKKSLMNLSDKDFEKEVAAKFPERYGAVKLAGTRAAYPLTFVHAESYIAPRMALVADAAHGIHPVAGQGLNLGFRDVKALADLAGKAKDPGSEEILQAYQRARRFDNTAMIAATDGMVRLFSSRLPGMRLLRRTGLKLMNKTPAIRHLLIKEAMGSR